MYKGMQIKIISNFIVTSISLPMWIYYKVIFYGILSYTYTDGLSDVFHKSTWVLHVTRIVLSNVRVCIYLDVSIKSSLISFKTASSIYCLYNTCITFKLSVYLYSLVFTGWTYFSLLHCYWLWLTTFQLVVNLFTKQLSSHIVLYYKNNNSYL